MLNDFESFLQVERQLSKRTVYSHRMYVSRLIGETGKDGHRGLYSPKMDDKQLREFIASILAKSIRENLASAIRA